MGFFHFRTLEKYTASLLDLFNDIQIEHLLSNNKKISKNIPIQYTNREKSDITLQLSHDQIFSGNTQILPRMCLVFNGLQPARERQKNKFIKINSVKNGKKYNFQFNSIPYNFNYQVVVQTRGMSEMAMIIEQICSYFNPSYTLKIKEIPFQEVENTSVVLDCTNVDIQQQDYDDYSTNIVTATIDLNLRGNIYPAIKEDHIIKEIQMFLYDEKIEKKEVVSVKKDIVKTGIENIPEIIDIIYDEGNLICIYSDFDSYLGKMNFYWKIDGKTIKSKNRIVKYELKKNSEIECQIIDDDKNQSNIFKKIIIL